MYDYKTEESEYGSLFLFRTDHNYDYSIEILISPHGISDSIPIFEVSIDCLNSRSPRQDTKVGQTICSVINRYLIKSPKNILIYVCESNDQKAHLRDRKFSNWYSTYNSFEKHQLYKFKYDIVTTDMELSYYTSAAFDNTVYPNNYVEDIFTNYTTQLSADKINN
jgi:aromatic ring-opening dioxygenase catalytic subunit (LigB family)